MRRKSSDVGGDIYSPELVIRADADERLYFYNIMNIKKEATPSWNNLRKKIIHHGVTANAASPNGVVDNDLVSTEEQIASENSIPDFGAVVNHYERILHTMNVGLQ